MKPIRSSFPVRTLVGSLCFGLAMLANHAMASVTYRMNSAVCTDSNHSYQYFPDYVNRDGSRGIDGAGPKICHNNAVVEVKMRDGYVPGTEFSYLPFSGQMPPVENFRYNDGARSLDIPFGQDSFVGMEGSLPGRIEPTQFWVNTNGWGFFARDNGTWYLGLEAALGPDGFCNLGSNAGPGGCRMGTWAYESVGTYRGWQRVPEPATVGLLSLTLGIMGALRFRQKKAATVRWRLTRERHAQES